MASRSHSRHGLIPEYYKCVLIGSKVVSGDTQTNRQNGELVILTFLFKELKAKNSVPTANKT
jgi:hypothetical protein